MEYQSPIPPFYGNEIVEDIDLETLFSFINEKFLFLKLWGFRKKALSASEYEKVIDNHAKPALERLKKNFKEKDFCTPKGIFGFYNCHATSSELHVYKPETCGKEVLFNFPREKKAPFRSISDFFKPDSEKEKDLIVFQIVTIGSNIKKEDEKLMEEGSYKDYFYKHGFSMALTEALADYVQSLVNEKLKKKINHDINLNMNSNNKGLRFSPGFSSCPNLEDNKKIMDLLEAQKIGITITETFQMVPEYTTAAFIVLNPEACYF